MDAEIMNILKAKRDAVEALEFAMREQVKSGSIASAEGALRFVKTWAEAMDAMVPAEIEIPGMPSPVVLESEEIIHYRPEDMGLSKCGVDIDRTPYTYASPVRAEATCKDCLVWPDL